MKRKLALSLLFLSMCSMSAVLARCACAQSDVISPGDNLVLEGIPPIPASLAETVDRYTAFRAAFFADWSPTGREMLITTRFGDAAQTHRVKMPGGARTQLTFFKDPAVGGAYQPTKGDYFLFNKDVGGSEFYQFYRYDFATGAITLLTDGKSRNGGYTWSHAGNRIGYGSTRRNGADTDLYVMDPAYPKTDHLVTQMKGGGWSVADWSPDDQELLASEYVSINESYLWLVDLAAGTKTLLTPKGHSEQVAYQGARFSRDGNGLYVTTDRDSEINRLAYIDLATNKITYLTNQISWDVDAFALSYDGKQIAFVANEDGIDTLHLLQTATGEERRVAHVPTGVISGLKWHRNNRDVAFTLSSARSTSDVYSLDVKTNGIDRWTYSETSGLNTANFSEPELVHWKSFDQMSISGFLYRPASRFGGKHPVIINIHGGPEGQFQPGFIGAGNYLLNEMGVAILYPNIRGSSGYGKTFLKLDNGFLRQGAYKDIGALLDWIKTRPDLDSDHIMITGGSYGGHMTLAVATLYSDRIRCALDIVGMSNLVTFLEHTEAYRRDLRRAEYGDERDPKMREFMERIAPLNHTDRISKPLFIVAGKNDPRVPVTEAEQMVAKVRQNGTPVWYLMAKDEGHGFVKHKNVVFQLYATMLFVQRFLIE